MYGSQQKAESDLCLLVTRRLQKSQLVSEMLKRQSSSNLFTQEGSLEQAIINDTNL